jgi:hypothetical protein
LEKWRKGGFVSQCFEEVESVVICDEKRTCFEKRGACDGILDGSQEVDFDGIVDGSLEGSLDGDCEGIMEASWMATVKASWTEPAKESWRANCDEIVDGSLEGTCVVDGNCEGDL